VGTLASELRPLAAELSDAPRVYVDANVPLGAVHVMREQLHWDVLFVLEHDELRRAPDLDHFRRALDLGRTLITLDHDFFDDVRFPPTSGPGVIVCTVPDERALIRVLKEIDRTIFRVEGAQALPLLGKKIEMVPGPVGH
jgi:hypothetical protein